MSDQPTQNNLPTRVLAQGYLNYLREIRGDECYESCTHSVATNRAEHCLEARASGILMTREEFIDSLDVEAAVNAIPKWIRDALHPRLASDSLVRILFKAALREDTG